MLDRYRGNGIPLWVVGSSVFFAIVGTVISVGWLASGDDDQITLGIRNLAPVAALLAAVIVARAPAFLVAWATRLVSEVADSIHAFGQGDQIAQAVVFGLLAVLEAYIIKLMWDRTRLDYASAGVGSAS